MIPILPVANGILPRPDGGRITGIFDLQDEGNFLEDVGIGRDIFVCPWLPAEQELYPVGIVARITDYWLQEFDGPEGQQKLPMGTIEGRTHAHWHGLREYGPYLLADSFTKVRFRNMRDKYPVISGAGWQQAGGYTEFRSADELLVTIYGHELTTGYKVKICGKLGGIVDKEHAHTVEHAIIRALSTYGLCTVRTLAAAMQQESAELRESVENSFRLARPELLGITTSGACGNPMTNLAHFYLAQELLESLQAGKPWHESLTSARRRTMSQLTGELGLTAAPGTRALQGLKFGMSHNDLPLKLSTLHKILERFPFDPWS